MNKVAILLFCLLVASNVYAQSRTFSFSQSGFSEAATITGTFTGEDLNMNGQLSSFDSEITDFQMSFSGNSIVPAFSLGFGELFGLVYDLDGGPLGDGLSLDTEGIGAADAMFSYNAGPGPVDECGQGVDCGIVSDGTNLDASQQLIPVSEVIAQPTAIPIPYWALVILALMLGGLGLRGIAVRE